MNRTTGIILAMGVVAVVLFGLMAAYMTQRDPYRKLKRELEHRTRVTVETIRPREDTMLRRTVLVIAATARETSPDDALAAAVARSAFTALGHTPTPKTPFAAIVVELEGLPAHEYTIPYLKRWGTLDLLLTELRSALVAVAGPDALFSVVSRKSRLGIRADGLARNLQLSRLTQRLVSEGGRAFDFLELPPATKLDDKPRLIELASAIRPPQPPTTKPPN
jgi:hypothetical protein